MFNFPYIYLDRLVTKKPIFEFKEYDDYKARMGWVDYQVILRDETLPEFRERIIKEVNKKNKYECTYIGTIE